MEPNNVILRRSPFVMLRQIILIEIGLGILYLIPTGLSNNPQINTNNVPLDIYALIGVIFLQVIAIILTFIRWYQTTYIINHTKVVIKNNFINKIEENIPADKIASLVLSQDLISRQFNFGDLIAKDNQGQKLFTLKDVPEPAYNLSLIEQLQDRAPQPTPKISSSKESIEKMLKHGENQNVEFKASFMWDNIKNAVNKDIQHAIMKTISGFMNTQGGTLLIGINDEKEIIGIENDLKNVKRKNTDGFENLFNIIFNNMIGVEFSNYVEVVFHNFGKETVCMINVQPSTKPVYVKNNKDEEFYIRAGNSTHPLTISEATRYIQEHFEKKE